MVRLDKEKALKMRLEGNSYLDISKKLGVPKSTLSSWFSELQLSEKNIERINKKGQKESIRALVKYNQQQTTKAIKRKNEAVLESHKDIQNLSERDIFILGVSLYWAEGYKKSRQRKGRIVTDHPISLTNSDPKLVKIFLRFLREYCQVEEKKIRANVRIFEHQNPGTLLQFWSNETHISRDRIGKVYVGQSISSRNKRPYNQLPYGTIQIRVSDTGLFYRIMGWIERIGELG